MPVQERDRSRSPVRPPDPVATDDELLSSLFGDRSHSPVRSRSPVDSETLRSLFGDTQIVVKTFTGKTITLDISEGDSQTDIKAKLVSMGCETDGCKLSVQLEEGHPLGQNPIVHNATFLLVKTAYRIWVSPVRRRRFKLYVEASDTIHNLKTMIQKASVTRDDEFGIPVEVQHLSHKGKYLSDDSMDKLADYNIEAGGTIICKWNEEDMRERVTWLQQHGD